MTDDQSAVQRVEYSLDADRWRTIHPKDGIADSRVEQFELPIDGDTTDKAIILRAMDAMSNVATARAADNLLSSESGEVHHPLPTARTRERAKNRRSSIALECSRLELRHYAKQPYFTCPGFPDTTVGRQ